MGNIVNIEGYMHKCMYVLVRNDKSEKNTKKGLHYYAYRRIIKTSINETHIGGTNNEQ